jgi:hypothetical protein
MACRCLPQSDDRVDEALRLRGPTRPVAAKVFGEFAFTFGAGVHQQVSRHRDSLRANAFGKIGKALVAVAANVILDIQACRPQQRPAVTQAGDIAELIEAKLPR